nr:putative PEP-binding protein [Caloranaerobacter azorensis]
MQPSCNKTNKDGNRQWTQTRIWVGMCGEMAGDPKLIPILIGMGLDEFSMSPISILRARRIIRNIERKEMEKIANQIIDLPTAEEIEKFIDELGWNFNN